MMSDRDSCDQCLLTSVTTTSVGSGSWGAKLVNCASLQLARFTTVAAGAPASILSFGSMTFNPLLSRKNVWSPNNSFNFGTNGWSSGITWASNCVRACSTCAEFSFMTDSIRLLVERPHSGGQSVAGHSCDPTQSSPQSAHSGYLSEGRMR